MHNFFVRSILLLSVLLLVNGCQSTVPSKDQKNDTSPPVITLIGDSNITLDCEINYRDFRDPGATAWDDVDGNITSKIRKYGLGSISSDQRITVYTFIYKVSDEAGNKAKPVKRVVRVGQC